jgi:hypothetical protein
VLLNLIHLVLLPDLVTNYMKQSNVSKHVTSNISEPKEKASPHYLQELAALLKLKTNLNSRLPESHEFNKTPQVKKPLMSATTTDVLIRLINCSVFSFQRAHNPNFVCNVAAACLLIQTLSYLCIMVWWMTSNGLNWILVKLGAQQIS